MSANQDLFKACEAADLAGIRAALSAGADPDAVHVANALRMPALAMLAMAGPSAKSVFKRKLACVKELAAAGADLEARAPFGTSVGWATISGDAGLLDFLIASGADVGAVDEHGMSSAWWAVRICCCLEGKKQRKAGVLACLEKLLLAGANPFENHLPNIAPAWRWAMGRPMRVKCVAVALAAQGIACSGAGFACPPESHALGGGRDVAAALGIPVSARAGWARCPAIDLAPGNVAAIEGRLMLAC